MAASTAAVGPPPGLVAPKMNSAQGESTSVQSTNHSGASHMPQRLTSGAGSVKYGRMLLLKLAASPLVPERPADMPAFDSWFGEWEAYTPRPHHNQHSYYQHNSQGPMGSFGQGTRGQRDGQGGSRQHHNRAQNEATVGEDRYEGSASQHASGGYLSGFQGVRRREGEREGRYRKADERDLRDGHDTMKRVPEGRNASSRFAGGKNPFGQVSATGAFKPAGRDPGDHNRGHTGRPGARDRHDDEFGGMPSRGTTTTAGRRRGQFEDAGEEGGDWETVPRSPEAERKLARQAGGLADATSDWRRAGTSDRPPPGLSKYGGPLDAAGRGGRRGGPSGSFPSWMADDSEPSWMNDDGEGAPLGATQTSAGHERKERGKLNFDAFRGSENIHVTPREGEDSIQAFKREMKEREKRAKGIADGDETGGAESRPGPPPGLTRPSKDGSRDDNVASEGTETNHDQPRASVASSSKPNQAALGDAPAGRGASRFARFFDGNTATNKAKEAQERALASASAASPAPTASDQNKTTSLPPSSSSANGLDALLHSMNVSNQTTSGSNPAHNEQPSAADMQGMQKIMAMLRGSNESPSDGKHQDVGPERDSMQGSKPQVSSPAAANLMAMLAGRSQQAKSGSHAEKLQFEAGRSSPSERLSGPNLERSQSPNLAFQAAMPSPNPHQQQGGGNQGVPHHQQQRPPMPPFGTDPRILGGRPPPPGLGPGSPMGGISPGNGGFPPHLMAAMQANGGRDSPHSNLQHRSIHGDGGAASGPGNPGPLAGLPPHIQHQLMGLPPHVQYSILNGGASAPPPPPVHPMHHYGGPQMHMPPPGFGPASPGPYGPPRPHSGQIQHVGPYAQQQTHNSGNAPGAFFGQGTGGN